MKTFTTLLIREIKSYFYSPIAYVVLCYFLILMGFTTWFLLAATNGNAIDVSTQGTLIQGFFSGAMFWYPFILVFPLITMRVFSEEFRMGTIETLTTAPVGDTSIVLSKFFASFLFSCLFFIPSLGFYALFSWVGHSPANASASSGHVSQALVWLSHLIGGNGDATANATGVYWTTYALILLISLFYCSIGCLASALTKDQVNAAVVSFTTIILLLLVGFIPEVFGGGSQISRETQTYILPTAHMADYSKGIIDSRPIVYYLSMTVFMVFLTLQVFQYRKWSEGGNPAFFVLGWLTFMALALVGLLFWEQIYAYLKQHPPVAIGAGAVILILIGIAISVRSRKVAIGTNVIVQLAVLTLIVFFVNYLSFRHFKRLDYSRDQQYALSPQTKSILTNLQKPVHLYVYFSTAADVITDLDHLLHEYELVGNKNFSVEGVDPYRNLNRAEELKGKYKIQDRDNVVILDYEGRSKFVNAQDMVEIGQQDQMSQMMGQPPKITAFKGEAAITSALRELVEGKTNKVYLVTGHGEPDITGPEFRFFSEALKKQNIQTASLNLLTVDKIPEDANNLVIYGPKHDFSELEMKLIGAYWDKKGSLMIFLNPFAKTPRLSDWLTQQGVTPQDDRVIGLALMSTVDPQSGLPKIEKGVVDHAVFDFPDSAHPVIKDLGGVSRELLGPSQSLLLDQAKSKVLQVRLTPLVIAAENFWGETDFSGDLTKARFEPKSDHAGDKENPLTIGASVEKGAMDDPHLKVETARLIVVGNSEFLTDKEDRVSEESTDDFAINAINWLLAHEEAIGIPPKEKKTVMISLTPDQLWHVAILVIGIIPGLVAFFGVSIWAVRRS